MSFNHTQKQRKIKIEPRVKLNHNITYNCIMSSCYFISDLSSSDSDDGLPSPSYASFLQYDHKPVYSDVVKKQMVGAKSGSRGQPVGCRLNQPPPPKQWPPLSGSKMYNTLCTMTT